MDSALPYRHRDGGVIVIGLDKMTFVGIICITGKVTILFNQQVQSDRNISDNKPENVIRDNEKGTCMLIDVASLEDRNVITREAEKVLNYEDLTIEIRRMWNV